MFEAVLIANRGEIARRVIRTLRRLGIRPVTIHAAADAGAPHVLEGDETVTVPSYLDIAAIIEACRQTGATALHPGYGFLSENPALARACAEAGVTFIGPPPEASERLGDKLAGKELARATGVPVVPMFTEDEARDRPDAYPLLIKAAAGGGGRGMRVVHEPRELDGALAAARREAQAGFGDDRVFIERFLSRARHLEVQVIADAHGHAVHLGERECSLQRRHQKVIEESPSPAVSPALRATLGGEAVALMQAGGYVNAGTVEFVADAADPAEHYFLEVNARLQVEHPVTELVSGLDLVELQVRVAAGEPLGFTQDDVVLRGHAIEARVCAEDAARDFLPAAGTVLAYDRPPPAADGGVRVDDAIETGSAVDTSYDSLLAKVIAHGADRPAALGRLAAALAQTTILGVTTTTGYLRQLVARDEVRSGDIDTGLVERLGDLPPPMGADGAAVTAGMLMIAERAGDDDPFARVDGWRLSGRRAPSYRRLAVSGGDPLDVEIPAEYTAMAQRLGDGRFAIAGRGTWRLARDGDTIWLGHNGYAWPLREVTGAQARAGLANGELRAPMPGQVLLVPVAVGDTVRAGDPIVVLESMKMELVMSAPADGTVAELTVAVGDRVALDQPLARVQDAP
jgi:acetyl-CoA/propionyl-CoA carboxylase biotin carboxyl carrier protein